MAVIAIPGPLREKLGDEAVDSLVELLNKTEEKTKGDVIALSEEKFERRLTEENNKLDKHISEQTGKLNERIIEEAARLDKKIAEEAARLDKRISEESAKLDKRITDEVIKLDKRITDEVVKLDKRITEECATIRVEIRGIYANIIKWMFIFWIGQIGAILGMLFAFFKPEIGK